VLEILANVAQILGFTLQAADFVKRPRPSPDTEAVFVALLALTSNAKAWKSLHAMYHPLGIQIHSVVGELSEQRNGRPVPRDIQYIAPNSIRELFYDNILNDAVVNFRSNTRKDIKAIEASLDSSSPVFAASIEAIKKVDHSLGTEFEEIAACRQQVLEFHSRFLKFLADVGTFIGTPIWSGTEVKYVLDNRNMLARDLPQMIYTTDKVLMSFLDIYIKVVSDHAKAINIASSLKRGPSGDT
jgi:hypothetical protein